MNRIRLKNEISFERENLQNILYEDGAEYFAHKVSTITALGKRLIDEVDNLKPSELAAFDNLKRVIDSMKINSREEFDQTKNLILGYVDDLMLY